MTATDPLPPRRRAAWITRTGWTGLALLCLAVAASSARYLLAPPQSPAEALGNGFGVVWLPVHVAGGVTALVLGLLQFTPALRRGAGPPHRCVGRLYVLSCLVGGLAGLILAAGSTAGPIATAGFGGLGIVWMAVTVAGWRAAVQGRFADHRRWMIRSWALTLAAVTLRIYLPLVMVLDLPFPPAYRAISFLCWVPNLVAAELWLRFASTPPLPASRVRGRGPQSG